MTGVSTYRNPLSPPIVLKGRGPFPILLSIPHSGTDYPAWLLDLTRKGRQSLEPLEDPLVDRLAGRVLDLGVGAVIARAPRAAIDCNRSPREIDASVVAISPDGDPGPRARAGLGIVPGRTPQVGELWRRKISHAEFLSRWSQAHVAYHEAIAMALAELRAIHAEVLLLDCHSMPPRAAEQTQVVLGDRHGGSCASWLSAAARASIARHGRSCSLNDPYAGGWIIERHGRPNAGVHALQIELDRSLYLDEKLNAPGPGFESMARLLAALVTGLGEAMLARAPFGLAAE